MDNIFAALKTVIDNPQDLLALAAFTSWCCDHDHPVIADVGEAFAYALGDGMTEPPALSEPVWNCAWDVCARLTDNKWLANTVAADVGYRVSGMVHKQGLDERCKWPPGY